jgi:hypothetical protein
MKFFTRGYRDWTDDEYGAVARAYHQYVNSIADRFPAEVMALYRLDLHDGLFLTVAADERAQTVSMRLRCGNLQVGYFDVNVGYEGAAIVETETGDVLAVVHDPEAEILYDEVGIGETRAFEHRLLLWPRGELTICFDRLSVETTSVASREAP